jgi:hypothetical protein
MRRTIPFFVLALAVVLVPAPGAHADDAVFGVRAGYFTKADGPMIGGEVLLRLAPRVYFNPNVEYVFIDGGTYLTFNADVHYDFPHRGNTYVWAGAGLGVVSVDPTGPAEETTDVGANFIAGIGFPRKGLIPYFQAKLIAKDDTEFSLAVGLRF